MYDIISDPRTWPDPFSGTDAVRKLDLVSVRRLQLPQGVLHTDIWGHSKEQPAYVNVALRLRHGLRSAAYHDAVNSSTVHYGKLTKQIRSNLDGAYDLEAALKKIGDTILDIAMPDGEQRSPVSQLELGITLPKGSTYGEAFDVSQYMVIDQDRRTITTISRTFTYERLKIMTFIGVNAVERTGAQALLVTCSFYFSGKDEHELRHSTHAAARYERVLAEHIQDTKFETLEALAEHLYKGIFEDSKTWLAMLGIKLKLEKPSAVLHADAPAIEIFRAVEP